MLIELQIRDFALIERLDLSFYKGFSVLTGGKRGGGKSIIVDALGLLLGGDRASLEMIRSGAQSTEVSGSFTLNAPAAKLLEEWGMLEGEELIIARELNLNGRNKCWINGRLATVGQLAQLGPPHLVDIIGQYDSQRLLHPREHGRLLDGYGGGAEHSALLAEANRLAKQWSALRSEMSRLQQDERERNRQIDLLAFQTAEIAEAALKPGEDEHLELERNRLANLDRIREAVSLLLVSLGENFAEQESILRRLSIIEAEVGGRAAQLDATLNPLEERFREICLNLNDLYREFSDYLEQLPADPNLLQTVELRLDLIDNLRRKYGAGVAEILAYGRRAEEELEDLKNAVVRVDHLERESAAIARRWLQKAKEVTISRAELARGLEKEIEIQLSDLSMANTRFKVQFTPPLAEQVPRPGVWKKLSLCWPPTWAKS